MKMTFNSAALSWQAVKDVWGNVALDEKFSGVGRKPVADFVET